MRDVEVCASLGDGDAGLLGGGAGECGVGACEGVDAVVVGAVGEGGEFVEEVVGVAVADELDESVFGGGGDGGARMSLSPVTSVAVGAVAAEDVAGVAVDEGFAGGAWFLLDDDADLAAVAFGGGGDELFDAAWCFPFADDVGDVEGAGLAVEFEAEADGPVGIAVGRAWVRCWRDPSSARRSWGRAVGGAR